MRGLTVSEEQMTVGWTKGGKGWEKVMGAGSRNGEGGETGMGM